MTRRSAGLPLIISTILASEARIKQVSDVVIVHTLSDLVVMLFSRIVLKVGFQNV